jgi:hypothetical protein
MDAHDDSWLTVGMCLSVLMSDAWNTQPFARWIQVSENFFSHFARCPNPVAELLRIGDYQELQHALAVIQQQSMKQVLLIKMAA